jgi:hypothetical protein
MLNSCPKSEDLPGLRVLILVRKTWTERGELRGEGVRERGAYGWSGEKGLIEVRDFAKPKRHSIQKDPDPGLR